MNDSARLTLREDLYVRRELEENPEAFVLTWLGHACFKITYQDYSAVIDPYADGSVPGLPPLRTAANEVFCSHQHDDHNNARAVTLLPGGPRPFAVETLQTYHDDAQGEKRGDDLIHIFSAGGLRVAHFGDIGCALTPEQRGRLAGLDGAMIPVGGFFTIDARQAKAMTDEIRPRVVVPMHYRGAHFGYADTDPVEAYAELAGDAVFYDMKTIVVSRATPRQTAVLHFA